MATTTVARGAGPKGEAKAKRKAPFVVELYRSSVGKKYVMAITGIMIMGFVLAHMIGNLKMYLGPAEFDGYGEFLRELLVPILPRTVLLTRVNAGARSTKYQSQRDYVAANYASRTMRWSGVIFALFLVWHLFDLSWTGTGAAFHRGDPYGNVDASLSRIPVAALYIVANIALGFHLFHGAWSLFQSLGWNNPRFNAWRRNFATGFAALIVIGNVSFPIMVLAGVVAVPH
jgi:succinate dehydrogenase / fumarate reductase cytochrome b subunit